MSQSTATNRALSSGGTGISQQVELDGCVTQVLTYNAPSGLSGFADCYLRKIALYSCPPDENLNPENDPIHVTPGPGGILATSVRKPKFCDDLGHPTPQPPPEEGGPTPQPCPPPPAPIWQMGGSSGPGAGATFPYSGPIRDAQGIWRGSEFRSNASPAVAWWYDAQRDSQGVETAPPFIEVKHSDGSIARYDHVGRGPNPNRREIWRVTELRDPYDNVTRFHYSPVGTSNVLARLTKIEHASGITEEWHYNDDLATRFPSWDHANHSFIEVRYFDDTQTPRVPLADADWAMVFENGTDGQGGTLDFFLGRLVARYTPKTRYVDPHSSGAYLIPVENEGRSVTLNKYQGANFSRRVSQVWQVRSTHPFYPEIAIPATEAAIPVGTDPIQIKQFTYEGSSPFRVTQELSVREGVSRVYEYNNAPGSLPTGYPAVTLERMTSVDGGGNRHHRDFDPSDGRIWVEEIELFDDPTNRPRAAELAGNPNGLQASVNAFFPNATLPVEPHGMRTIHLFDQTCVCQKPIRVTRVPLDATGAELNAHERVWTFQYDSATRRISEQTMPNPSTEPGASAETRIKYEYTSKPVTPVGFQSVWSASLIERVTYELDLNDTTDDIVVEYTYPMLRPRVHPTRHGQAPSRVEKAYASLTRQTGLGSSATTTTSSLRWITEIDQAVTTALSEGVGGALNGLLSKTESPDGSTYEVTARDSYSHPVTMLSGAVQTSMTHDAWGNIQTITSNAGSSVPQLVTYETSATGALYRVFATVGGVLHDTRTSYDRWGNTAIVRRWNKDGAGSAPSRFVPGPDTPRDWVEDQYLYDGGLLIAMLQDRRPLDEARASLIGRAADSLWLRTEYEYDSRGEITKITHPNGAVTTVEVDGYGIPYTSVTTASSSGGASVQHARMFYNYHLEPVFSHQGSAQGDLWTHLERDADSGVVTKVFEPEVTTLPVGYTGSPGGLVHRYEYDSLGRVIERRATDPNLLPFVLQQSMPADPTSTTVSKTVYRYDELGRVIRSESTAHMPNTDEIIGHEHVSIATFDATNPLLLQSSSMTGTPATRTTTYGYDVHGRLKTVTDALLNQTTYDYQGNTDWVSKVTQLSKDGVDPTIATPADRTDVTQYVRDSLGRVTTLNIFGTNGLGGPGLTHLFEYGTLGQTTKYTDPENKVHEYLTDALGRLIEHARLGSSSIVTKALFTDFHGAGGESLIQRNDGLGHTTKTYLDFLGRPVVTMMPGAISKPTAGAKHQDYSYFAEYDDASRRTALYDGEGGKTEFHYDGPGRLIQSELTAIHGDIAFYAAGPNSPAGDSAISGFTVRDRYVRDSMGRALQTWTWGRSASGLYAQNTVNQFVIDSFGRTHQEASQVGASQNTTTVNSGFDNGSAFRNDLTLRDGLPGIGVFTAESMQLDLQYDADVLGRLDTVSWNRDPATSSPQTLAQYSYLGAWQRSRVMTIQGVGSTTSHQVDTLISFDQWGRANRLEDKIAGTVLSAFDYVLDKAGNLEKEIYDKQDGSEGDRFAYDDHHRLTAAWLGANQAFLNKNDPQAPLQSGESFVQKLTYGLDNANNRTAVTDEDSSGTGSTETYTLDGSGPTGSNRYATVGASQYVYDKRGNLIFDGQLCYLYDYKNRLSEVLIPQTQSMTLQGGPGQTQALTAGGASSPTTSQLRTSGSTYVVLDETSLRRSVERVSNDCGTLEHLIECKDVPFFRERSSAPAGGAVLPVPGSVRGGGMLSFADPDALATSMVPLAFYAYDATNRRSLRYVFGPSGVDIRVHVWDGWREVIESEVRAYTDAQSETQIASVPIQQFVWGLGLDELVAYRDQFNYGSGLEVRDYWATQGGQDTTVRVLDENAMPLAAFDYDAYGMPLDLGQVLGLPGHGIRFLWKGMRVDGETLNGYRRHRYYSFGDGRFLTHDPLGIWFDSGNLGNGYAYGFSNPLAFADPFGLQVPNPRGWQELADRAAPRGDPRLVQPDDRMATAQPCTACHPTNATSRFVDPYNFVGCTSREAWEARLQEERERAERERNSSGFWEGVAAFFGGFVPGVGESMDAAVVADSSQGFFWRFVAGASLLFNVCTLGVAPNAGGFIQAGTRGAGRGADDLVDLASPARRGTALARELGPAGEAAAGIVKNTERIASASGTAAYRIPDVLDHSAKIIGDVKNVKSLSFTNQLRDFAAYAAQSGYTFELTVRPTTQLSGPLQQAVASGSIVLRFLP